MERKWAENYTNNTKFFRLKLQSALCKFQTITVSECCLIKLLPYILFEKYINILALEMASSGNRHCANCIDSVVCHVGRAALSIWWALRTSPCRGPNPSVDRRVRWMRRAPGRQGAPDGQQAKKLVVTKCLFYCKINIL